MVPLSILALWFLVGMVNRCLGAALVGFVVSARQTVSSGSGHDPMWLYGAGTRCVEGIDDGSVVPNPIVVVV